jgi:hypothetical protein
LTLFPAKDWQGRGLPAILPSSVIAALSRNLVVQRVIGGRSLLQEIAGQARNNEKGETASVGGRTDPASTLISCRIILNDGKSEGATYLFFGRD